MIAKSLTTCLSTLISLFALSQPVNWKKLEAAKSDRVLLQSSDKPAKALLLGSFHFGYPNLDGHKTDSSKMIDVLSPARQKEIQQLVDVIKQLKPTRVYIESQNQQRTDSLYNAYLGGTHKLRRNEVDQVGFRLAKEMGHSKVYAVDAGNFASDHFQEYKWIDSLWNHAVPVDSVRDRKWDKAYSKLYSAGDSLEIGNTILESFLMMADKDNLRRMHGHYLCGGFNTTDNKGPDAMSIWWYNRNLRIYNNILKTRPTEKDRIVVLFGNGHIPILKHCFESSPEFEVVELKYLTMQYLGTRGKQD